MLSVTLNRYVFCLAPGGQCGILRSYAGEMGRMSELPITELSQAWQRAEPGAANALARQVYNEDMNPASRTLAAQPC
ncbi:hypothetical protein GGR62_000609 [Xanthomonas campestris]|nr:hypothetical protein [Xanthomonas sp. 3075]